MKNKSIAFTIDTLEQAKKIILYTKIYKTVPILHIKNYILKGFGSEFVISLKNMLIDEFGNSSFKLFVDCGFDNSLSINMATKEIHYIKLRGNSIILNKIKNITKQNKVLLNPSFNIVDCRNIKSLNSKIKKIYIRETNEN